MNLYVLPLFIIIFLSTDYSESAFPSCEDILKSDGDDKPQCVFCETDRMKESCKDLCESKGCNKIHETAASSSSSSTSESQSSSSSSSSSSKTASESQKESSGSGKHGKKGKNKGGAKKVKGKKKKHSKESKRASSKKESSSSSSNQQSSSSNQGSSSSSNQGSSSSSSGSSSSNQGSSSSSDQGSSSSSSSKQDSSSSNQGSSSSSNQGSSSSSSNQESSSNQGSSSSSAVSSSCDGLEPCVPIDKANEKYRACCKEISGITPECVTKCGYDVTKQDLIHAFTHHICELDQSRDVLKCAASHKNNGACCQARHVYDNGRDFCEPFCNPASVDWPTKAQARHLKCLAQFDVLMKCHYAAVRP